MLELYKKATVAFIALFLLTLLIAFYCYTRFFVEDNLLPAQKSAIPWDVFAEGDERAGGESTISVQDATYSLDFTYIIKKAIEYPTVTFMVAFDELRPDNQLVDLSQYSGLSLRIKCQHKNFLSLDLRTLDRNITKRDNLFSYRISQAVFSCDNQWSTVDIDLQHMKVPLWWLEIQGLEASSTDYRLDEVLGFSIGASRWGPTDTATNVKVSELALKRKNWIYVYLFIAAFCVIWAGYTFWLIKQYTKHLVAEVRQNLRKDRPLIAYQKLSIQPHKDKEKEQVLRFMATEYANPNMSVDYAISKLGINRSKINDILKEELEMTFSAYLNKLRLAEAARLLAEGANVNVAEIAYSVGYKNVTYFNKLFKKEYGCTPKSFTAVDASRRYD